MPQEKEPRGHLPYAGDSQYRYSRASGNPRPQTTDRSTHALSNYCLHFASWFVKLAPVRAKDKSKRRSGCPVSISLEIFGDHWSLLIIRDLMVRGLRTFKEFLESGEGIATNILADRLKKLGGSGIIAAEKAETDGRRVIYRLTEKGIDLAPILLELLIWGSRHEEAGLPCSVIDNMTEHREEVLAEARRRWRERDLTPLFPTAVEVPAPKEPTIK